MHGNDIADALLETYASYVRSKKWWYRVFHFLLDLEINNAYLLYRTMISVSNPTKKSLVEHSEFLISLISEHLEYCETEKNAVTHSKTMKQGQSKLKKGGFPNRLQQHFQHFPEVRPKQRCVVCAIDDKDARSVIFCLCCDVNLCLTKEKNCFKIFHTQEDLFSQK
jgi:hypothetical protein